MTVGSIALPPIPVHNVGWTPTAYGVLGTLLLQLAALTAWVIKKGPEWISSKSAARKQDVETDMAERRAREEEEERATKAVAAASQALTDRVARLEDRAQKAETVAMYLTGALASTLNALRTVDPNNAAVPQASNLIEMAIAAGGDSVFAKGLAKLASVPGVGE